MKQKVLNLQYPDKSDIKYNIIHFPDGEIQLHIIDCLCNFKDAILIKTRITCANDWFILLQVQDILERSAIEYHTIIFYLMSQRSDRLFQYTRPLSLKIILSQLKNVSVFRAHNLDATRRLSPDVILSYYPNEIEDWLSADKFQNKILFFPDEHAADEFSYLHNFNFLYGKKTRNVETGEIVKYEICQPKYKQNIVYEDNDILVFDDLCDGGGTFILALDKLKKKFPEAKFHLFVYHAVQEVGLKRVCADFDTVTTTNSYADWDDLHISNLKVINIW
jgi:ribose-phosphate pyrophosphokinase